MKISFKSKTNNINQRSDKENDIQKKIINSSEIKEIQHLNNNSQVTDPKDIKNKSSFETSLDKEKNSSKNLADFFNGQIVDTQEE